MTSQLRKGIIPDCDRRWCPRRGLSTWPWTARYAMSPEPAPARERLSPRPLRPSLVQGARLGLAMGLATICILGLAYALGLLLKRAGTSPLWSILLATAGAIAAQVACAALAIRRIRRAAPGSGSVPIGAAPTADLRRAAKLLVLIVAPAVLGAAFVALSGRPAGGDSRVALLAALGGVFVGIVGVSFFVLFVRRRANRRSASGEK